MDDQPEKPGSLRPMYRFASAGLVWGTILRHLGFAAVYTPWRTIYILPEYFDHARLRRHEIAHARQCARDGFVKFWARYTYWSIRHGYAKNPYEIEARAAENEETQWPLSA